MPTSIKTQKELDKLVKTGIKKDEEFVIEAELKLNGILRVSGSLTISRKLVCDYWNDEYVEAWGSATVRASGSATVEAWDSATVRASGSATVRASDSATVEAWDSVTLSLLGFAVGIVFPSVKIKVKADFAQVVKRQQVFKTKKKTTVYKKLSGGLIATLELPKGAVFQSALNQKCRTASAKVLKIEDAENKEVEIGYSQHDSDFVYEVGKTVSADYDEDIAECSSGIHFFLNPEAAENY